jgi:predicted extracellular nuclease
MIDPVAAAAQGAGRPYYESLEGMLVRLDQGTTQSGGTNKFGELFLLPGDLPADPLRRSDPAQRALIGIVDDAGAANPANPLRPPAPSTTLVRADAFALVSNVEGPLSYTFSHYKVAVQPSLLPTVTNRLLFPFPGLGPAAPGDVRIASFNLENFFPVGGALDGGIVSPAEFDEKRTRLSDAIGRLLGAPDIVAVQEVADLPTLAALATQLGVDGHGSYTAYLEEGNDNRGIDVGFLVRSTVTVNGAVQYGRTAPNPSAAPCSDVPGRLFDRPPLGLDVTLAGIGRVVVFSNHFASKAAPDACRDAQAGFVRTEAATLEAAGVKVIITGDLNAFEDETPLAQLQAAPATLTNLWPQVAGQDAYSFQFNGLLQTLDHMVVSDGVDPFVASVRYPHTNTDYASRSDGHGASDHNPVVLVLNPDPGPGPVIPEFPVPALAPALAVLTAAGWFVLRDRKPAPAMARLGR